MIFLLIFSCFLIIFYVIFINFLSIYFVLKNRHKNIWREYEDKLVSWAYA